MTSDARPVASSGAVPIAAAPSKNEIVPLATPVPPVTAAVNVTGWPKTDEAALDETVVAVAAGGGPRLPSTGHASRISGGDGYAK